MTLEPGLTAEGEEYHSLPKTRPSIWSGPTALPLRAPRAAGDARRWAACVAARDSLIGRPEPCLHGTSRSAFLEAWQGVDTSCGRGRALSVEGEATHIRSVPSTPHQHQIRRRGACCHWLHGGHHSAPGARCSLKWRTVWSDLMISCCMVIAMGREAMRLLQASAGHSRS